MIEPAILKLFENLPVAGVLGLFTWALFQLVKQVVTHYQSWIDTFGRDIVMELRAISGQIERRSDRNDHNHKEQH